MNSKQAMEMALAVGELKGVADSIKADNVALRKEIAELEQQLADLEASKEVMYQNMLTLVSANAELVGLVQESSDE